jgi:type IV pilus assembly protein PilE
VSCPICDRRTRALQRPSGAAARGLTLLELVIAVAVVGILVAVALPSFLNQLRQTRRADALDAAAALQQAQERWRANNISYATSVTPLGVSKNSPGGYYTLAISDASATGYTLTLAAVAGTSQASDAGCATLTVTVVKGVPTTAPAPCWKK